MVADPDVEAVASVENPLILPSVEQEPLIEDEVVVAGAVTSVDEGDLAEAADATEETPTEVVDLATDQSEAEDTTNTEVASEDAEVELKPKDVEDKAIDIGPQTKVPGGDYKLGTANYMP